MPLMRLAWTMPALGAALVALVSLPAASCAQTAAYATEPVTFMSGTLRIAAVLGRPEGEGPFPVYVQNHGSMTTAQASGPRWATITRGSLSDTLARHGYVVLVVARRGYRGSEGTTLSYSADATNRVVRNARDVILSAQAEAGDVVAAVDYPSALPHVDRERITVGGVSLGGLVSVIAAARESRIRAVVSMAGGYRQTAADRGDDDVAWPLVQQVWKESATKIRVPTLILWSRNDRTVDIDVGRDLEKRLRAAGQPVEMRIYPPFAENGHALFSRSEGAPIYARDVLRFLDGALGR